MQKCYGMAIQNNVDYIDNTRKNQQVLSYIDVQNF